MKKGFVLKVASVFLSLCIVLVSFSMLGVSAAKFSGGSGTRNDPYLIKTADDLYNMRDNLSASYKLAATIDMKGYKTDSKYFDKGFVPIGDDSTKPFTGSFTCDLGTDGLPLYAILNLKINNKKGEIFKHDWYSVVDYPDALGQPEPYYWQTALFANTDGANIHNIYVLGADIYSSVVGQHDGRYDENGNKVMYGDTADKMSTAILVGTAVNTTISHCGVKGKVNGKSSNHGGLVGRLMGSNISDSYADVTIDTGGCWHVGNLVGRVDAGSSITNSVALGKLNASLDGYGKMLLSGAQAGNGAGGFIGSIAGAGVVIQNCWAAVELSSKTNGNNFYGYFENGGSIDMISNCFTYGKYQGKSSAPSGKDNKNNCYISNAVNGLQAKFNAASPAEITKYFLSVGGWVKGDKYPVLASTNMVENVKIYVPGKERKGQEGTTGTTQNNPTSSNTTSSNTTSSNTTSSNATSSNTTTNQSNTTSSQVQTGTAPGATQSVVTPGANNIVQNPQTNDTTVSDSGTESQTTNSEVVEETISETQDGLDTTQMILIIVLSVMIIGNCVLTAAIAHNTLKGKRKALEEIEGDEQDDE